MAIGNCYGRAGVDTEIVLSSNALYLHRGVIAAKLRSISVSYGQIKAAVGNVDLGAIKVNSGAKQRQLVSIVNIYLRICRFESLDAQAVVAAISETNAGTVDRPLAALGAIAVDVFNGNVSVSKNDILSGRLDDESGANIFNVDEGVIRIEVSPADKVDSITAECTVAIILARDIKRHVVQSKSRAIKLEHLVASVKCASISHGNVDDMPIAVDDGVTSNGYIIAVSNIHIGIRNELNNYGLIAGILERSLKVFVLLRADDGHNVIGGGVSRNTGDGAVDDDGTIGYLAADMRARNSKLCSSFDVSSYITVAYNSSICAIINNIAINSTGFNGYHRSNRSSSGTPIARRRNSPGNISIGNGYFCRSRFVICNSVYIANYRTAGDLSAAVRIIRFRRPGIYITSYLCTTADFSFSPVLYCLLSRRYDFTASNIELAGVLTVAIVFKRIKVILLDQAAGNVHGSEVTHQRTIL
ncbi:MAG TPA: hypothetical protein IAC81_01430 [Candidatus Scatomorpha stercorigallinarum]|nr:hypothetical protein [Candidatus Scatomorpha stercorigallinarum]